MPSGSVLVDIITTQIGPGNNGYRLSHLQFTIYTNIGLRLFRGGMPASWRGNGGTPDVFPTDTWKIFWRSLALRALEGYSRPIP